MTIQEKNEVVFKNLNDGFDVYANVSGEKRRVRFAGCFGDKLVGVYFVGKVLQTFDMTNEELFAVKTEKICDASASEVVPAPSIPDFPLEEFK